MSTSPQAQKKGAPAAKKALFRKASMARLSSSRELDWAVRVTPPRDWVMLTALGIVLTVALCWGFFGEVHAKVKGLGIIIKPGALFDVVSLAEGQISQVLVRENQIVGKGDLVAVVEQPELAGEVREARKLLDKFDEELAFVEKFQREHAALGDQYRDKQRQTLEDALRLGRERMKTIEDRVRVFQGLLDQGLITRNELDNEKNEYRKALLDVMRASEELTRILVSKLDQDARKTKDILAILERQVPQRERLAALQEKLDMSSRISSAHGGRVIEIFKDPGDIVKKGQALFTMEVTEDAATAGNLEASMVVAYIPPFQGLDILPGMAVQIVPAVVRKEEYGVMLGDVVEVSQYPASRKGMARILPYEELAERLSQDGAPILIKAALRKNPDTPSGFDWSSGLGPPTQIKSGTLCAVEVVARSERPIDLVLPMLNKTLLGVGDTTPEAGR
jgi:HlyD family secretion protein